MSKTFMFAGTCVENGAVVYKFANKAARAKELERFGCTDVNLIELPAAMDKEAAVAFLATKNIVAAKAPRVAKEATVKVKAAKAIKVVAAKKVKRVPREYKASRDAEAFVKMWFESKPTAGELAEAAAA